MERSVSTIEKYLSGLKSDIELILVNLDDNKANEIIKKNSTSTMYRGNGLQVFFKCRCLSQFCIEK
ncbi:1802_t:CDS:2, partial [Entrophospora sp. SA101]